MLCKWYNSDRQASVVRVAKCLLNRRVEVTFVQGRNVLRTSCKYIVLSIVCSIVITCCPIVRADSSSLPQIFIKCDELLGKNPKAVLAVLGQPDEATSQLNGMGKPSLVWKYTNRAAKSIDSLPSVTLMFLPNRVLFAVVYNGLRSDNALNKNEFSDGGKNAFTKILETYNYSSIKIGFVELFAQAVPPNSPTTQHTRYPIEIEAVSKKNNKFYARCSVDGTNPLIQMRKFSSVTGTYTTSFGANPDFTLFSIGPFEDLTITSPSLTQYAQRHGYMVIDFDELRKYHFVPVTEKIMALSEQPH